MGLSISERNFGQDANSAAWPFKNPIPNLYIAKGILAELEGLLQMQPEHFANFLSILCCYALCVANITDGLFFFTGIHLRGKASF